MPPENEPAPAPAPAPSPAPPPPPAPPASDRPLQGETFPRSYVEELRGEAKGYRLNHDNERKAREAAEAAKIAADERATKAEADKAAAEATAAATKTAADQRIIMADLRTAAVKAGMVDLDGLKLADLSTVTIDDNGDVQGADALLAALKTAKPYLFGDPTPGTARPGDPPKPAPPTNKKASDLNEEEYKKSLRGIAGGKRPSDTLR